MTIKPYQIIIILLILILLQGFSYAHENNTESINKDTYNNYSTINNDYITINITNETYVIIHSNETIKDFNITINNLPTSINVFNNNSIYNQFNNTYFITHQINITSMYIIHIKNNDFNQKITFDDAVKKDLNGIYLTEYETGKRFIETIILIVFAMIFISAIRE